jgi:prepilin-type N-terminal cleavage/methylation domain-containing protein
MRRFPTPDARRHGFTLVEMLVSLALIVFIMSILSYAFQEATGVFRTMKSSGDMAEKLRAAMVLIRRDVSAYHFDGARRLSDASPTGSPFWLNGPPIQGYFRVWHGSPTLLPGAAGYPGANCVEGTDLDGLPSYRSTNHMLACTVQLKGNLNSDFFSAYAPTGSPLISPTNYPVLGWPETRYQNPPSPPYNLNSYNSRYAEVAYFLRRQAQDTANGTPLFTLYRRQWVAVPVSGRPNPANNTLYFNSMADLTVPPRRYGMQLPTTYPVPATAPQLAGIPTNQDANAIISPGTYTYPILAEDAPSPTFQDPAPGSQALPNSFPGGDALLTDVLSFDVRLLVQGGQQFEDLFQLTNPGRAGGHFTNNNPQFNATTGPLVFDTWSGTPSADGTYNYSSWATPGTPSSIPIYQDSNTPPNNIRVLAVQITLRIWDLKTQQSRQVTLVQEL